MAVLAADFAFTAAVLSPRGTVVYQFRRQRRKTSDRSVGPGGVGCRATIDTMSLGFSHLREGARLRLAVPEFRARSPELDIFHSAQPFKLNFDQFT